MTFSDRFAALLIHILLASAAVVGATLAYAVVVKIVR